MPLDGKISLSKKYVSRKLNSVRWKPSTLHNSDSNIFITGSWDDEVCLYQIGYKFMIIKGFFLCVGK